MTDHHTEARQKWLREQQGHAVKLADAIAWLTERGKYCLATPLEKRIYKPAFGVPLEPIQ